MESVTTSVSLAFGKVYLELGILKDFKSFVLGSADCKELRGCFADLRIVKDLACCAGGVHHRAERARRPGGAVTSGRSTKVKDGERFASDLGGQGSTTFLSLSLLTETRKVYTKPE
jgi:hypothetical protein